MNAQDLVFYNKEGYRINTQLNERSAHVASFLFDKNSTDTFKSQAIYTFEHVDGDIINYSNIDLKPFQLFNTDGIFCYSGVDIDFVIYDIKETIKSADYNTRWIFAKDIHKYAKVGQYINFDKKINNSGYVTPTIPEFDEELIVGAHTSKVLHQIKKIKQDAILIYIDSIDNTTQVTYNDFGNGDGTFSIVDVVEYTHDPLITYNTDPLDLGNGTDDKQRFSLITNDDVNGVYTTQNYPAEKQKFTFTIPGFIPNPGDEIKIDILFRTNNLNLSRGIVDINQQTTTGHPYFNSWYIELDYIPKFINDGDDITLVELGATTLFGNNGNLLTIDKIMRDENRIYVTNTLTAQPGPIMDVNLVLATNKLSMTQTVIKDNNGVYSSSATFAAIIEDFQPILDDTENNIILTLNNNHELEIYSKLVDEFISVEFTDINGIVNTITSSAKDVIIYPIDEKIKTTELEPNSEQYKRTIRFNNIGNILVININGIEYSEPFNTDIPTTLNNFVVNNSAALSNRFININQPSQAHTILGIDNVLEIESIYPNTPVYVGVSKFFDFDVKNCELEINSIINQLTIKINGIEYSVPFNTDELTTMTNWVAFNSPNLKTRGIIVEMDLNTNNDDIIAFYTKLVDAYLDVQVTPGFKPINGSDSIIFDKSFYNDNSFDVISGNKLMDQTYYDMFDHYSIGQTLTISGTNYPLVNVSYTITEVETDYITLSYQGVWDNTQQTINNIVIETDDFIRRPMFGLNGNNRAKLKWSWKRTQIDEFFLYDFSGELLRPYRPDFPNYGGPIPLCDIDGTIDVRLNKEPNKDKKYINTPEKQQTVFDEIEKELLFTDEVINIEDTLKPYQTYIGYKCDSEMWNDAKLYLEFIEDIKFDITTTIDNSNNIFDEIVFDGYTITAINSSIDFIQEGLRKDQLIEIKFEDVTDSDDLMTFKNKNEYKIIDVTNDTITVNEVLNNESSYQIIDNNNRFAKLTFIVKPKLLGVFTMIGETEAEDERHRIHLDNKNKNILHMNDVFIFKEVDINEQGIDWIFLNRKRKELLEVYGEIFNYISSYKAINKAISFFGYNDLIFSEYFQNVNVEDRRFGQVYNLDLLKVLDKYASDIHYNNYGIDKLRHIGYTKTNLFSLGFKVTDDYGNFINSYSLEEVKIKLLGLKRWLTEHLVPLGAKINDINARYTMPDKFILRHESYMNKNFRVEEYSSAVFYDLNIQQNIVTNGNNTYDISLEFKKMDNKDSYYFYDIKTYNIEIWNNINYNVGSFVEYKGDFYEATQNVTMNDEPTISSYWQKIDIDNIPIIQHFSDYKTILDFTSFTVTELLDPYFEITVYWHSGYANTYKYHRSYHLDILNQPDPQI